ncbi:MAG: RecX family transcriptional regulator [Candidatus Neomarinimicrobiota bacterium]|jgi:regulatory protein|nr:RecX family transcriptional regulator [Candidatus Neomarinimicrobiota bacterium]MDD3965866.1 RecX family transcriptional regulator [Candidatus Neomarinimicrobiota bacterium]MDX9780068.1 RecX family transcriptional regulator [bacterium]
MSRIVRITQQKRHPNRYNLFLDDDTRISVTDDMILEFSLSSGKELRDEDILKISLKADEVFTREKALELLSMREHSRRELSIKLRQKGYQAEIISKVLDNLESRNYISDTRFSGLYAEELIRSRRLGPLKVREKLFSRGISGDRIREILSGYGQEEQAENCRYHFEKKRLQIREENPEKAAEKMIRYLQGKGFDWEIISRIVRE